MHVQVNIASAYLKVWMNEGVLWFGVRAFGWQTIGPPVGVRGGMKGRG